jgi:hypothetical protein
MTYKGIYVGTIRKNLVKNGSSIFHMLVSLENQSCQQVGVILGATVRKIFSLTLLT